jgi:mycobactin lysine-N-oxygenase
VTANSSGRLAVIGAGAKAIAIAAKPAELRAMGVDAPDVVAVERSGVWTDLRPKSLREAMVSDAG